MRQIVYNAIRTPDGTILESTHQHDFQGHIDKKTHLFYAVDGGLSYLKRTGPYTDIKELSLYDDDPFEQVRKYAFRFNLEKGVTRIKDMSNEWLQNAIDHILDAIESGFPSPHWHLILLVKEKQYRIDNELYIEENTAKKRNKRSK